ncbi:MAG: class D sortase, partial [Woeseiaceae bacterium]
MPGKAGNVIIAGHRDTHFRFLSDVEPGELLGLETGEGQRHVYEVIGADVVDARKGSLILDTESAMLTLVTCYPFEARDPGGPMRYVVTAKMLF